MNVRFVELHLHRFVVALTLRSDMGNSNRSVSAATRSHNRISALMTHIARYSFRGTSRLASDSGLAKSTISQLVHGKSNPLYSTLREVVKCFEFHLGRCIDLRDVASDDGTYPTRFVCDLAGCPGCLPDSVYRADGSRKPEFQTLLVGRWTGDVAEFLDEEVA